MKFFRLILFTSLLLHSFGLQSKELDWGAISQRVAQTFEANHYSRHPLDAELSRRFLDDYLDLLDADHLFFTKADVEGLVRLHGVTLVREIEKGEIKSAWSIHDFYRERAAARVEKILKSLLDTTFEFNSDRTAQISRAHSSWPTDEAEADRIWSAQIEGEVLEEKLGGATLEESVQKVKERYELLNQELGKQTRKEVLALVLSALARAYDPHSDYLTKADLDDLDSDMRLSMVGIGVVLEADGRYVKIASFLPGGPAAVDGRLKLNDRIVAVAHGAGPFVDVVGLNFDRVLELLRTKKGGDVRLQVIAPHATGAAVRSEVALTPRKIELMDEAARAELIERTNASGQTERLGWITLPSFYGDPQHPEDRSSARDVRALLIQLNKRKMDGLVVDLRNNPGGELEEAVDLGGLFLGKVPIVLEKDGDGKAYVSRATVKKVYSGPVIVLTNHLTASAAELFAGAMKDYRRALIVGGNLPTYGKGSIQTVVELSEVLPRSLLRKGEALGALDLTIGKFYRVSGSSTQLHGLDADLHLPSPEDLGDEGESALSHPLAYDETQPLSSVVASRELPIPQLRALSEKRVAEDPDFARVIADLERDKKAVQVNRISLNESQRRAELEESKQQKSERAAAQSRRTAPDERVSRFGPEGIKSGEPPGKKPLLGKVKTSEKEWHADPVRAEALNILSDLVQKIKN